MTSEDQSRTALHDRLGPLLADLRPSPALLDNLAVRQRRRTYREAAGAAAVVAAIVAAGVLFVQWPRGGSTAVVTPLPSSALTQTGAPLPGPTVTNPRTVAVPNVIGVGLEQASSIVQAAGLEVAVSAVPSGQIVVAQSPSGGWLVVPGSTLQLTMGPLPTPRATVGALLPDGSRLPVECPLPATQDTVPSPDDSFLAYNECGGGQFSLTTGMPVRYVSAAGLAELSVSPGGDVYFVQLASACNAGRALVLSARDGTVTKVAAGGNRASMVGALSHSVIGTAWAQQDCAEPSSAVGVVIRDTGTHLLTFDHGVGTPSVGWTALANDGRLAVSYDRSDGTTDCPLMTGGGCRNIVAHGISIVTANDRTVPAPQLLPKPHCEFDQTAWSGATLVVVEWCDGPRGSITQYPGTLQLVRLDPATGRRLSATDLPTDWGQVVRGVRAVSDGDVLVAMGSAKLIPHILRLHAAVVSELNVPQCSSCSWAEIYP